jgi:glycosyltransferase involved in cell wall biosynthesis
VAPGVDLGPEDLAAPNAPGTPLRVAFNHRWEHDKDPRAFLEACLAARARGARLELVLLGERFGALPAGTPELLERLRPAILHSGYLPVREDYRSALAGCDLALSTAQHEFVGISTVEALAAGVTPLLPNRLSYPEVVGPALRRRTLYGSPGELVERLCQHAEDPAPLRERTWREALRQAARPCSVESTAAALDTLCLEVRDKSAALPQD